MRRVWAIEAPSKTYVLCCDEQADADKFFSTLPEFSSKPYEAFIVTPAEIDRMIGDQEPEPKVKEKTKCP